SRLPAGGPWQRAQKRATRAACRHARSPGLRALRPECTTVPPRSDLVPERGVAAADGCLETLPGGALLERVALGRVPRAAVQQRAQDLRGLDYLLEQRLVHEQLHHHELVHRQEGEAARDPVAAPAG